MSFGAWSKVVPKGSEFGTKCTCGMKKILSEDVDLSIDAYFCGGNNKIIDMNIARSPFSVRRTVRTFKETYQKLEMGCRRERQNSCSKMTEKPELIEQVLIAAKAAGVVAAVEFALTTLI